MHVDGEYTFLVQLRESPTAPAGPEGNFREHLADMRTLVEDFDRRFFS